MSLSLSFLTTLRPKRPDFLATLTPEEKAMTGQHTGSEPLSLGIAKVRP